MTENQLRKFCFKNNIYIVGGYALGKYLPDYGEGNDIDLICKNKDDYNNILYEFSILTKTKPYKTIRANTYSINNILYQFINPNGSEFFKHGHPEDVIKSFDLSGCQIAMIPTEDDWTFVHTNAFKWSIDNNTIRIMNLSGSPLVALYRLIKYVKKGFDYDVNDIPRLMWTWRNAALSNCYIHEDLFISLLESGGK